MASEAEETEAENLTSHNLLLCFLNETTSDWEEEEQEDLLKIPPNHPLANLQNRHKNDDWQSDDSSSTEEEEAEDQEPEENLNISESISAKRVFVEGNISRKKGHVIIPLRCSSEAQTTASNCSSAASAVAETAASLASPKATRRKNSQSNHELETGFFQQLAIIQVIFVFYSRNLSRNFEAFFSIYCGNSYHDQTL